jgi:molecular chaperone HtpG
MATAGAIPLKQFQGPELEISEHIMVGKDVLDLVTGAMYVDPLSIYREYIQNAADAIQEARDAGLYTGQIAPKVHITVDSQLRAVTIRDNGIGVAQKDFIARLTAVGASKKRGTELRGFRGVGRLSGLGYCQQLVFRSRAKGDRKVSELIWDGKKLKELLRSDVQIDLSGAIRGIAKTRLVSSEGYPDHFF